MYVYGWMDVCRCMHACLLSIIANQNGFFFKIITLKFTNIGEKFHDVKYENQ